jgi:endonuclease G
MKYTLFAILFTISQLVYSNPIDTNCPSLVSKYGAPSLASDSGVVYRCRSGYAVAVSSKTKDPIFSAEHLTAANLVCTVSRTNNFKTDTSLPIAYRSYPRDYLYSSYDQGHMSSAQDFCYDATAMKESFFMSNMVPQDPGNNRGIWPHLEAYTRALASYNDIYVISGPIFVGDTHATIGSGVSVPEKLFKVIYNETTGVVDAYILPNAYVAIKDLGNFHVTINEVELATGLTIFPLK